MSLITSPIGKQAYELIHDQLGAILAEELVAQAYMAPYPDDEFVLLAPVWKERDIPFNDSEIFAVNVMLERGEFELQTLIQQTGEYRFIVEVSGRAKGNSDKLGDTIAMNRVQRLMGVIRAIIMSPKYVTLGFQVPFVEHRRVENFFFGRPIKQDSSHTVMGRMTICVRVTEFSDFSEAQVVSALDTTVGLYETDSGYVYVSYYSNNS